MLQLKNIYKNYIAGTTTVNALKDIRLKFRNNEFVSVLGPSGCGKTTMLNLLGGLDRYTSGDLIINGKSTRDFTDPDWDAYRNRKIGFVFQNYNLIPHQTVLRNVELALTLSGVSKSERRKRAVKVLENVGLADQIHKKPNQMSGGQMQRVSIARALVNNPDILLADEPTGSLDSETSEQIMSLIKSISNDRLVIMVTHNQELAEKYSTRIIRLFDGKLEGDSNPVSEEEPEPSEDKGNKNIKGKKKTSMSFFTALSLSANNLMTKKVRTFMTAFAGSIGIIGIALIMALSNGSQSYIDREQENTLSAYPIRLEAESNDLGAITGAMLELHDEGHETVADGEIHSFNVTGKTLSAMLAGRKKNDLEAFKQHLEDKKEEIEPLTNSVAYRYDINLNIYAADYSEEIKQINPFDIIPRPGGSDNSGGMMGGNMMLGMEIWTEIIDNPDLLNSQYDILAGRWPEAKNEVILVANENNRITDYAMYALGLKDSKEIEDMIRAMREGKPLDEFETETISFTYDELIKLKFKMVLSSDIYKKTDGAWIDMRDDEKFMRNVLDNSLDINVVGLIRPSENASSSSITGTLGYTKDLTEYVMKQVNDSKIVKEQKSNEDTDIFTDKPFADPNSSPEELSIEDLSDDEKAYFASLSEDERNKALEEYAANLSSGATYDENLAKLGVVDENSPNAIYLYPKDFDSKKEIEEFIKEYNKENPGEDGEGEINYTDYIGIIMTVTSTIIGMISSILIAFVGISLIVSSIMIGIITYVSVLERTREIGILKSIGARKRDISRVFSAETLIIGFVAGTLGILISALLTIPANIIIQDISGASGIASLPLTGAGFLVALSMILTLISGFIPSKIAAKKDPVVALRSE
ncbi:MAG: ABC transporter ATP-binding protein/permease [Oscillospiraceae bacterium]|nr:ABC transporter ATP-binding protein/permease [Oscillospiraceae bacterium]